MFPVIYNSVPNYPHDRSVLFEPRAITFHVDDIKFFGERPIRFGRFILNKIRLLKIEDLHAQLKLRHVVFRHLTRYDLALRRALDLDQFSALGDTVGAPAEPGVHGVGDQANLMDDLSVSLFVYDSGFVLVFFAVFRRRVPHELFTEAALF